VDEAGEGFVEAAELGEAEDVSGHVFAWLVDLDRQQWGSGEWRHGLFLLSVGDDPPLPDGHTGWRCA
jgi:hypothetical protein